MLTPGIFGLFALVGFGVIVLLLALVGIGLRFNELQRRVAVLSRIEAKVDLLLQQANIKFDPYANLSREVVEALQAGQKLKAIQSYVRSTGVGLKEAKDFIEGYQLRSGVK